MDADCNSVAFGHGRFEPCAADAVGIASASQPDAAKAAEMATDRYSSASKYRATQAGHKAPARKIRGGFSASRNC